jgi:P27 family predicted phage terminase small subunit
MRGNPGKRPIGKGELRPTSAPECPEPPAFLDEYSAAEWRRVAPELWRLGLLTVLDHMTLAVYAVTYGRWRQCEELLAGADLVVEGSAENMVVNPILKVAVQAARDVIRFGSEFGLTPAARVRVRAGIDPPRPPSKFGDLIA